MEKLLKVMVGVALTVLLVPSVSVIAVPTINTPEPFATLSGWTNAPGDLGGSPTVDVGAIGGHGSALRVMFAAQGGPIPTPEDVRVFATSASSLGVFTGDYTWLNSQGGWATFDFFAQDYTTPASTLSFFFHSSLSSNIWTYALNGPAATNQWYTYNVPMTAGGWTTPGAGTFLTDLATVDQIGILITRSSDLPEQWYGLDDFELLVPEPSTYAIIAFTLLTLGLTMRRRRLMVPVRSSGS